MKADPLSRYKAKRNFGATPEPSDDGVQAAGGALARFVVQKHWASHLHYDLRLEIGGTMKSWAVPKGPSLDPAQKRLAVAVEDHPISYNTFEGKIPAGQYGAGRVIIWDKGFWVPDGPPASALRQGRIKFALHGHKLNGRWTLVRIGRGAKSEPKAHWMLIKERDAFARRCEDHDVLEELPDSVASQGDIAMRRQPAATASRSAASRRSSARKADAADADKAGKAALAAATKAPLPKTVSPALASLVTQPPHPHDDWLFELKFDGYRILARVEGQQVRLMTRGGKDWSDKMPDVVDAVRALALESAWLDGEMVLPDAHGVPDFNGLQNAFGAARSQGMVYHLFDLPYYAGKDLRQVALEQRRQILRSALNDAPSSDVIRFSEAFDVRPQDLRVSACKIGFEGIVGKLRTSRYSSGRTADWVKLKCGLRQEFVIGGFTQPRGSRLALGALLLGLHGDDGRLHYAGKVGSGFDDKTLLQLRERLSALQCQERPFAEPVSGATAAVHWVQPSLLAEVAFAAWTPANHIRHAVFKGVREDKPARGIRREKPVASEAETRSGNTAAAAISTVHTIRITHGQRVIDAGSGATKLDLVRYYATVAPLLLEHLRDRPVALVRAPAGVQGATFFQKHQEATTKLPGVRALQADLDPGHAPLLAVTTQRALTAAAQMNVVEFHTWNARKDRIERPDRMCFDLDPGEGVAWVDVQAGADLLRVLLQELQLPAFLKTSGGKGLHVVVPIKRLYEWGVVKNFSAAVVRHLAQVIPERFVAKSGPRNRIGKIYVDFLRNGRGATTVSAWSARARPGMGISVPVDWHELGEITSGAHWHIRNIAQRLRQGNGPWQAYAASATSLTTAKRLLGSEGAGHRGQEASP